ncbi:ABC transporter substrate-binding protein [Arthrobacter sp. H14]|uniref:ABC transporter substrate-binding protein n=1 Tax=Arthrobacter sp. H14 TaxID=1312959 RepID=UPI00056A67CF|nr:ABC transporter substrate-binding protein [Arthrobacter sp. H14]
MFRRRIGAALATVSLLAVAACSPGEGVDLENNGGTGGAEASGSGETLVAAIAGEPDQLDPHKTSAYFSFQVLENVYDTLVEPDESLEMQPALAKSWEVSDDQLTWTFTLREDVTFHDGSEFSAEDVVYSYNRIIDNELTNSYRFASVESIKAPDPSTVVIKVSQPTPSLLSNIGGFKGMAIVSEENVKSGEIQDNPIGTGPFVFESYTPGDSIKLSSNPDYWGGAPELGGATFRFISEGTTALAGLTAGEVDWTDSIPPQRVAGLETNPDVEVGKVASNDYWYLALNQNREPYDDVRVRQAIAYALDRDAITQAVSYGNATVNQLAIPKQSTWYTEYNKYSKNLDKAKSLLDEAGVDELNMGLMVTTQYPQTVTAAQVIADQLSKIGITTEIRTIDFATWLDEQSQGNFDMLMLGWLGSIDPNDFYYNQHHSEGTSNFQGYSNPEVDKLLEAGQTETNLEKRQEIYDKAATMIADDASYIYLYNPDVVQAWNPNVKGYEARSDRAIRFRDVSLADN